jgi:signal transduction histidine kinase
LTGTPLYDRGAGTPIGSVWVQRDITVLKKAERLKDQFVSNVSHELRTPVSILALTSDNLEAYWDRLDECERRQMVQDIHEQAHLLSNLAEDILRISQIDGGHIASVRSRLDLGRLVEEEVAGQQPVARRRSHELTAFVNTRVAVMGNEMQLRQIVRNLLDNAIKFTAMGGQIICQCEVRGEEAAPSNGNQTPNVNAWAVLDVKDTGIGIAASELALIFERFYRVNSESDIPGTGLGLSIAQELTKQHGGWIGVASTPGAGSTFSVHLPLYQDEFRGAEVQRVECCRKQA